MNKYFTCAVVALVTIGLSGVPQWLKTYKRHHRGIVFKRSAEKKTAEENKTHGQSTITDLVSEADASIDTSIGF